MDVEEVVRRVRHAYASARLYSDRGTVSFDVGDGNVHGEFETTFERPDRFLFSITERVSAGDRGFTRAHRVLAEGDTLKMGDPEWRSGRPESLSSALGTIAGVSYGTSTRIPRLLLPERIEVREIFEGAKLHLGSKEILDGLPHLVVHVETLRTKHLVFVDERTFVIARTVSDLGLETSTTTEYRAVLTP